MAFPKLFRNPFKPPAPPRVNTGYSLRQGRDPLMTKLIQTRATPNSPLTNKIVTNPNIPTTRTQRLAYQRKALGTSNQTLGTMQQRRSMAMSLNNVSQRRKYLKNTVKGRDGNLRVNRPNNANSNLYQMRKPKTNYWE